MMTVPFLGPIILLTLGAVRIWQVFSDKERLDSYEVHGLVRALRIVGIIAMTLGLLYLILQLAYRPLVASMVKTRSEDGVEFYVVGVFIGLAAGFGPLGVLLFEASRLLGFEKMARSR